MDEKWQARVKNHDGSRGRKNRLKTPLKNGPRGPCYVQSVISPRAIGALCAAVLTGGAATACMNGSKAVLSQQADARRRSSELREQFSRAADASTRAVRADTGDARTAPGREAEEPTKGGDHD